MRCLDSRCGDPCHYRQKRCRSVLGALKDSGIGITRQAQQPFLLLFSEKGRMHILTLPRRACMEWLEFGRYAFHYNGQSGGLMLRALLAQAPRSPYGCLGMVEGYRNPVIGRIAPVMLVADAVRSRLYVERRIVRDRLAHLCRRRTARQAVAGVHLGGSTGSSGKNPWSEPRHRDESARPPIGFIDLARSTNSCCPRR